ncbi:hypothetical protein FACS1894103_1670 [Campylobacterota bacterium]|nr:hypothetical protein FACS1894103_1670 [Campylobacterota bacterium]
MNAEVKAHFEGVIYDASELVSEAIAKVDFLLRVSEAITGDEISESAQYGFALALESINDTLRAVNECLAETDAKGAK